MASHYDLAILGGGIVGVATARAVLERHKIALVVLEAEDHLAAHQTGHNSGVIHSGLYYKPGSHKATLCTQGRDALYQFCAERKIAHDQCGKVVVATTEEELPRLDELERRGKANGLLGMTRLDAKQLKDHEPHVAGIAGLHVPQTGIVDYPGVVEALAARVRELGGTVETGARVHEVSPRNGEFELSTAAGPRNAKALVNCAGLQCDRVARMCGLTPDLRIIPFRGDYWQLRPDRRHLVRNLIYPVPDPRFPFLGVHFTRMVKGGVEAGPNAVLALKREGYGRFDLSPRDTASILTWPGFWHMASRHWKTGMGEVRRSLSRAAFAEALRKLVPEVQDTDLEPAGSGVRAQAVARDGSLVDDFHFLEGERMLHVLNAPSPAATASIAIGESIAGRAEALLGRAGGS